MSEKDELPVEEDDDERIERGWCEEEKWALMMVALSRRARVTTPSKTPAVSPRGTPFSLGRTARSSDAHSTSSVTWPITLI
jgi:hypothetical protein